MALTKQEFILVYGYNELSSLYRLIREGKIVQNSDGLIETDSKENKKWCEDRLKKLKKNQNQNPKTKQKTKTKKEKPANQLSLEIDILNAKLEEKKQRSQLINLKIQKEKNEVVETYVLNRIIRATFDDMIKSLTEFPNIYAEEIIGIIQSAEEDAKEILVEYLTGKITASLKIGLDNAKQTALKYFENENSEE